MENIKILYVDDNVDPYISEYLNDVYKCEETIIEYVEREFQDADTYESLLGYNDVHSADIIIIDSVLFENAKQSNEKLTGEEFELILKKEFPFKEVIVVTQNELDENYNVIKKFDTSAFSSNKTFFDDVWKPILDNAIRQVKVCRLLLKRIEEKNYVERFYFEQLQQSVQGDNAYNKLTVADIDRLINAFKDVKKYYEDK